MIFNQIKRTSTAILTATIFAFTIVAPTALAATGDIVDVASKATQFSTLVKAVTAADLVTTLQGAGPFTVLAPTDAAFAKIPADTLEKLLLPANKAVLAKILTYHVISGKVMAADIVKLTTTKTVEGSDIKIAVEGTTVKLNGPATVAATVIATDIAATNGVIHSIDSVLIPSTVDLTKLVAKTATPVTPATKATVRTGGETQLVFVIGLLTLLTVGIFTKFKTSK